MPVSDLPAMTDHKLLPQGIHDATIEKVKERFGAFQRSDRRCQLFKKLAEYVEEVRKAEWNAEVIVDGSFVMAGVDEPGDIDLILVLPEDWDMSADVRPFEYNLVSKKQVQKHYGFDVRAVRANSPEQREWTDFFSRVNAKWCQPSFGIPVGTRKGLVRVVA
jgi:hypothetical protein